MISAKYCHLSIDPGVRMMGLGPLTSPWMEALPFFPTSTWMEVKPELIAVDTLRPLDERTAAFLCEVTDSIHPSIKVKADYPSKSLDQKMPLLDLKLWVEKDTVRFSFLVTRNGQQILYTIQKCTH